MKATYDGAVQLFVMDAITQSAVLGEAVVVTTQTGAILGQNLLSDSNGSVYFFFADKSPVG